MHKALRRQLRRALNARSDHALETLLSLLAGLQQSAAISLDSATPPDSVTQLALQRVVASLPALLDTVSESYTQFDRDLALRAHTLELSTQELFAANLKLHTTLAQKEKDHAELLEAANLILIARGHSTLTSSAVDLSQLVHLLGTLVAEQNHAKTVAEQASAAKDMFLATMSHEIRTPLNGLLAMLELLSLAELNDEQQQMLNIARDSGRGLGRIIDDILDHAKIEAGKLEIAPEPVSITQLLSHIAHSYHGIASGKGLVLQYAVDPSISAALLIDPLRLTQILGNLISNALKFTRNGRIEIQAERVAQSAGTETIRFSVSDTGIGISAAAQQRMFQPFEQASASTARLYGGTGLGLAICRRLAEMMGGSITVNSIMGAGTTMSVTLTFAVADAAPATSTGVAQAMQVAHVADAGAQENAPLILAVDDHPVNRIVLERQLVVLGMRVQIVEDAQEALRLWQDAPSQKYALMMTDCNMPGMDGYALARAIREIEANEGRTRIPIIAWTANALSSAAEQCHAAGMDDVLVKPAELGKLKAMLNKWLSP